MNLTRNRPPKSAKPEDLDLWLSGVLNDAQWDAREAGMDPKWIAQMYALYFCRVLDALMLTRAERSDFLERWLRFNR